MPLKVLLFCVDVYIYCKALADYLLDIWHCLKNWMPPYSETMKYNFVCLLLAPALLILATDRAWGDSLWRYGYSTQELRSNEGYNKYLKDRYGAEGIRLEGYLVGVTFLRTSGVGIGLEYSSTSGRIRYQTLNGEKQENTLDLQTLLLLLSSYRGNWEWSVGGGVNNLSRTFYGYRSSYITTENINDQLGTRTSETLGTTGILQGLYHVFNSRLQWSVGARYIIAQNEIDSSDIRPGHNAKSIQETQNFDLGGLAWLTTLTYRF